MEDFFELLDYCGFDVDRAAKMVEAKPLKEIINDILEEAGLDVEKIPTEP